MKVLGKEKIEKSYTSAKAFSKYFVTEVSQSIKNIKILYRKDKIKALTVASVSVFLISITLLFVSTFFISKETYYSPSYSGQEVAYEDDHSVLIARGEEKKEGNPVVSDFLKGFNETVNLLKPVLDGFVGQTADVTGVSGMDKEGRIEFTSGGKIKSSKTFYDKTYAVALLIAVLLVVSTAINLIVTSEQSYSALDIIKTLVSRFLFTAFLLLAGRYLMSYSIQFINEMNKYFRGGDSLTQYLLNLSDSIRDHISENKGGNTFVDGIKNILSFGTFNIINTIKALPMILPIILILLLLLFISLQFIIRWIYLYFLSAIQPLTAVFHLYDKTSNINESFWKTWFTLLLHQPFFVLGYSMLQNLLIDNLKSGPSFESILIFLATLLFLSGINVLVGRVFGDAWTATSANFQSLKANRLVSGGISKLTQPGRDFKKGLFGGFATNASSYAGKLFGRKLNAGGYSQFESHGSKGLATTVGGSNYLGKSIDRGSVRGASRGSSKSLAGHKDLKNPLGSGNAKKLLDSGYSLNPVGKSGVLEISGGFFAKSNGDGTSTLYTSKQDAIDDGVKEPDIRQVSLDKGKLLDPSNYRAKESYNKQVSQIAKSNGMKSKDVHITRSSDPERVLKGMNLAKESNKAKNINGVIIERIGSNVPKADNPKDAKRQIQIHVYDDLLK